MARITSRLSLRLSLALAACALAALLSLGALQPRARAAATFTVTNANDAGAGSLRQAIADANANPGPDVITFQIGTGPQTIRPLSALPSLTDPVVIDGATQPGYAGAPIVELDGSLVTNGGGLAINGGDTTVRALVINGFSGPGIFVNPKGGNRVEGCYIGVDLTGAVDRGNGGDGITLANSNNHIGGTTPAARNVISGNGGWGVNVRRYCCTGDESPMSNNVVQGNYVGVNAAGDAAVPNGEGGVRFSSVNSGVPVANNLIGGTAPGAGNLISGNGGDGLQLENFHVANNTVQGNFIGTDAAGSFAIPNTGSGVSVSGRDNLIGGTEPGARNVISGNGTAGDGSGVGLGTFSGNVLRGNLIGVNASQTGPVPNQGYGVALAGSNTVVGGTGAGEANVIAFNGYDGVIVSAAGPTSGNPVRGNSIFSNGHLNHPQGPTLGIDLYPDFGVTPNDAGDADSGGNKLQNFPVITSVTPGAASFNVKGTLGSAASTTYDLDFYSNGVCDPTGFGEGARRVGAAQVTTNSAGEAAFDLTFNVALAAGQTLTATATDPAGNTSEFSQCAPAGGAAVGSVGFDPHFVSVTEGGGVASFVLTRTGGAAGPITVDYTVRGVSARAGSDFAATSGSLTFADGETSKSFTVPVLEDALDETFNETAVVMLTTAGPLDALGSRSTATLVITDNDPAPTLAVGDLSAAEGHSGATAFEFPLTLSAVSGRDVTLAFETADGTASGGGGDYTSASSTVTIPAGQTAGKITVLVRGDADSEPDETFFVNITSASAAVVGDAQAQGTILNDDATPTVSLSVGDATVAEGDTGQTNAAFTVTLSAASPATVKVDVVTAGDTAAGSEFSNNDFQTVNASLTFAPGETTKTVNVPVRGDASYENDETFRVELRNPVGAFIADGTGVGSIVNDDPRPSISVGDAAAFEGHGGTTFFIFPVTLSSPSELTVQFRYRAVGHTATPDEDFYVVDAFSSADAGFITVPVHGDTITEGDETFFLDISEVTVATVADGRGVGTIRNDDTASRPATVQFDLRARAASEGAHSVAVTVTRSGDASQAVAVDYATRVDEVLGQVAASDRSDYTHAAGTLRFAAGETSKTFDVLLTDDGHAEPQEFITVVLSNATGGASVGAPAVSRINLNDNDAPPPPAVNPVDTTEFFVRQHYHDFLSREPDAPGLAHWTGEIESCGAGAACREVKRVNVSAAFFLSIEFQETGYLVYRTYKAAYGDATSPGVEGTVPVVRLGEFLPDTQRIGRDVVVGQDGWQTQLENNKAAYALEFVQRQRFLAAFPVSMTAEQFVDKLNQNAGGPLDAAERASVIALFGAMGQTAARASALHAVAQDETLQRAEFNRAFVLMQYFGYLRRNPNEAPEPGLNYVGWRFWLSKLEEFGGDYVRAEMVKAFINSDEYRQRFGQP